MMAARMRATRIEVQDPPDLAAYGLDQPLGVVTFTLSGQADTGIQKTVLVGSEAASDGVYAMLKGQDLVFQLEFYV